MSRSLSSRAVLGFITFLTITHSACTSKHEQLSVQAPKKIDESFTVASKKIPAHSDLALDGYLIGIKKASLEKEFLLRSQIISQSVVARFRGLRGRIVAFRRHGDEVLMLEANQGHVVDAQNPTTLLLAKFKLIKETDDTLFFDFNQGLSELYVTGDWYGSDQLGQSYGAGNMFQSAPLQSGYIEDAKFSAANQLVINQVGLLKSAVEGTTAFNRPIRAKFYISPYLPDPSFEKSKSYGDFTQFGYFEVFPLLGRVGWPETYYSKFNIKKPIPFAMSANIPNDFKEAVRDGILYWNKAFGRDVIQVTEAPAGVSAPDSELNIVQWVNWDWAGAAYADAQMDPRTGQILNAQIFMASVFALSGKDSARRFLRAHSLRTEDHGFDIGIKGFASSSLCNHGVDHSFSAQLAEMVTDPNVGDKDILRAAQDYVRHVVAHEVGHTLGLRHNFAGSLAANYESKKKQEIFKDYLTRNHVEPDLITTSSVMEYSDFVDGTLSGRLMKIGSKALPYDEKAIRHIYDGVTYGRNEVPPYCTDSTKDKFLDCQVFDSGSSLIEGTHYQSKFSQDQLVSRIMGLFINAKAPAPNGEEVPVERVVINAGELADALIDSRLPILKALEKDSRLLNAERAFGVVDDVNRDEVQKKKMFVVGNDLDRLGGLAAILPPWTQDQLAAQIQNLDRMIGSGSVDKGTGRYDQAYQFSSTEMALIRQRIKDALVKIYDELPERELKKLSEWTNELPYHHLAYEYANVLKDRVENILFSTTAETIGSDVIFADGSKRTVNLPVFKYKHQVRKSAYALLQREKAPTLDWSYVQRRAIKTRFQKLLTDNLTKDWKDIITSSMNPDARLWFLENREIYSPMDQDSSIADPEPRKTKKPKVDDGTIEL